MTLYKRTTGYAAILLMALMPVVAVQAQEPCFLLAETYYEQLFCEIKAKGQGSYLPRFYDFQGNNEMTQALLLKRPASRLGLVVNMPKKAAAPQSSASSATSRETPKVAASVPVDRSLRDCSLAAASLNCGTQQFQLVGNLANSKLSATALGADNKMVLPRYTGNSPTELGRYLNNAYQHYLDKMLTIGLGGSTMTFAKFHYLYGDLSEKGADFVERSKTVFEYLKKDKSRIAVSERLPDTTGMRLNDCRKLGGRLIACALKRKNILYVKAQTE